MEMRFKHNEVIILSGPSSSGKSYFCNTFFSPSQVLSSDQFRSMVSDSDFTSLQPSDAVISFTDNDEERFTRLEKATYLGISSDAFDLLKIALTKRVKHNRLTVIDATSLQPEDIKAYADICHEQHVPCSIIFFNGSLEQMLSFDATREKPRGNSRIKHQYGQLVKLIKKTKQLIEFGVRNCHRLSDPQEATITIEACPLLIPLENGIDVMGDGHGLLQSRLNLMEKSGYQRGDDGLYRHRSGRKLVYLNDESSRGNLPSTDVEYGTYPSIAMLVLMKKHVEAGLAYAVDSNHNYKIWRYLEGRNVQMTHGDELVAEEFAAFESEFGSDFTAQFKKELSSFLKRLPSHLIVNDRGISRAVITHAGIQDDMIGKQSPYIRDYCRFGPTDGFLPNGRPNRLDWKKDHHNGMLVIWGHEPHDKVFVEKDTVNVDTGGFCGHYLSLIRYPEMEVIQEKVHQSFVPEEDNVILNRIKNRFKPLSLQRFMEGFKVDTPYAVLHANSRNVKSVIELTSTKTAPVEEMIYIPPTMSPTPKTSSLPDYLEHPLDAMDYYKKHGVQQVICEKKHMGSRAVITLFKDQETGMEYFGKPCLGSILSRNGVRFFSQNDEMNLLQRLRDDLLPYFESHNTSLLVLDSEIMPWNLKATGLLNKQYDVTANSALLSRQTYVTVLEELQSRQGQMDMVRLEAAKEKLENAQKFKSAYEFYCWNADAKSLEGVQIAPFHILAFSGESHFDKTHLWHMEQVNKLSTYSNLLITTEYKLLSLNDEIGINETISWWEDMTKNGHEGMVVKPLQFISRNDKGDVIQPAIKVRGREYLRIIYGMDYLEPTHLEILKKRTAQNKMKNALKEFYLSMESINRFIEKESLDRIHECVLASLSYENDAMDPRL